jgi:hypothetical protein
VAQRADALASAGDYTAAEALSEQALKMQAEVLGEVHLDHLPLLRQLASFKRRVGKHASVLPLYQRMADIYRQVLGPSHPQTLIGLTELMTLASQEYGFAAGREIYDRMLQDMEAELGPDDPRLAALRLTLSQFEVALPPGTVFGERTPVSRSERREHASRTLPPGREALLAGLDDIPWHDLSHAYGPADDVPGLLRELLADDPAVREVAWYELYGNVWHQGTVYQATSYVVPFLLRMLANGVPPAKAELLHFLAVIAEGSSYLAVHVPLLKDSGLVQRALDEQGRGDIEGETQAELAWVEAANRAVGEGLPLYLQLLDGGDDEVRFLALYTLSRLRGRADVIVPQLRARLDAASQAWLRRGLVRALHEVMDASADAQQLFAGLLTPEEDAPIRLIAAAALAYRLGAHTPGAAEAALLEAVERLRNAGWEDPDTAADDQELPLEPDWTPRGLELAVYALTWLGLERAIPALLAALPKLSDPEAARETGGLLLDLVFNAGRIQPKSTAIGSEMLGGERVWQVDYWSPRPQPERTAASLDASQRLVLGALADQDAFWRDRHDLPKLYGLPATRDGLRQWLAGNS